MEESLIDIICERVFFCVLFWLDNIVWCGYEKYDNIVGVGLGVKGGVLKSCWYLNVVNICCS